MNWLALYITGGVCLVVGFAAGHALVRRGWGDAFAEGYAHGKAVGHVNGFEQGRAVSEKAAK